MKSPNFFIVGAPKSGTTSLYEYLRQHPQVFMPDLKEPQFFGADIEASHFIRDKEKYLSLFSPAQEESRIGEASVWYLFSEKAAKEICEFNPNAKIIIMLRNPVDMVYSLHSQLLYNATETVEDFQVALSLESLRKQGFALPENSSGPIKGLFYREIAKYSKQVKRYIEIFGRENVHIIIFDDFKSDTAACYRQTLAFLDVDFEHIVSFKIENKQQKIRSRWVQNNLASPPRLVKAFSTALLPRSFRQFSLRRLFSLNCDYSARDKVPMLLRKKLMNDFSEDISRLSHLLDRNLETLWH